MTEVKFRHLLFFTILFILTWFWNWIAPVFFALIIICILVDLYKPWVEKKCREQQMAHIKCVYYNKDDTMSCLSVAVAGGCNGICEHYQLSKTNLGEE